MFLFAHFYHVCFCVVTGTWKQVFVGSDPTLCYFPLQFGKVDETNGLPDYL